MKLSYKVALAVLALVAVGLATDAVATPHMNGAVIKTRLWNDCPISNLVVTNNYPAEIRFDESNLFCFGFANRHNWTFSADGGMTEAVLNNGDAFGFAATVVMDPTSSGGEGGLRLSPWWSKDFDGVFMLRLPDGAIECWGGVLPYYSFTASHGIRYAAGQAIRLTIQYNPVRNNAAFPGLIKYSCFYLGTWYDSPWLPFGNCTPGEEIHGCYGIMDDARAGGWALHRLTNGDQTDPVAMTRFYDLCWQEMPVPTVPVTWSKVKGLYR